MKRTYKSIQAVYQQAPYSGEWLAGYGFIATEGTALVSGGCYTEKVCANRQEAKSEALAIAKAYRNSALTMGAFTRDTMPKITLRKVGI